MAHNNRRFSIPAGILLFLFGTIGAAAQAGLSTIDTPQGGKIVYGQVTGQTTEAGAMGSIFRSLHTSLGDRPQVGKLFQVHGTESIAAFFSVTRKIGGTGQIAGLLIATKTSSDRVEAALVTDDAARFPKTLSPMMKTLFNAWHPFAGAGDSGGAGGPEAQLHQTVLPDHSASVSLPEGWQVSQQSAGGSIIATGPHDEQASLGLVFLASDTNNPNVQRTMRVVQSGGLRNTSYANAFYYPYGGDARRTFVDVLHHAQERGGQQPAKYNITSSSPSPSQDPRLRCANIGGTYDSLDGKGEHAFMSVFCVSQPTPAAGIWASSLTAISAPVAIEPREHATLGAILQSFNVNQAVVRNQAAQIAAPAIAQIHAIGEAARRQADNAHQMEDIHNSSVYQHWDSNDRRSQEFENYQLGYSVIADTGNNAHGTFWNEDADALVKSNPDRFEYVNAPNYWKGIDY
jgi:hypothetical protein